MQSRICYPKYFASGQTVYLEPCREEADRQGGERLSATLVDWDRHSVTLAMPYSVAPGEEYPFQSGMAIELLGEAFGLGLRARGSLETLSGGRRLRLHLDGDLQGFFKPIPPRVDAPVELHYLPGQNAFRSLLQRWQDCRGLQQDVADLSEFRRARQELVNLSSGGVRFAASHMAQPAEICLVLMRLEEQLPPVWALTETVWTGSGAERRLSGNRFLTIRPQDRMRLERFIWRTRRRSRPKQS